jgi:glycosyltransferase involved in cell wall biosynthesis
MRILLWHGYLLRGSGSNIYTANICRHWRDDGHDVLLMCQERDVRKFDFIDEEGDCAPDNRSFETTSTHVAPANGRVRVLRPAIGRLLPVYVYDDYEGFTVKPFVDLTSEELNDYTARNVTAMRSALHEFSPEAIITGHEVMGPYIAREACEGSQYSYLAKLHGSALEYAVKLQDRYQMYARDGLCGASVVVGGSRYMVREAASVVSGWEDRAEVVNPGCDIELFSPVEHVGPIPTVGYVGKLIVAKGVHNLLLALGLLDPEKLRAVVIGYGGFEQQLRAISDALGNSDRAALRDLAGSASLGDTLRFLDSPDADDAYFARAARISVEFAGRLDHDPLSKVLPTLDVLVVPSIVHEAFGMVAAEAAACGVLPVVPDHSGIAEVGRAVEEAIGHPGLLTYDARDPVRGIAAAIRRVLEVSPAERRELGRYASELARERWSWGNTARRLLELAFPR